MPSAKSPRINAEQVQRCKLTATHIIDGTAPRKTQSVYQAVATARGYTVKAGSATRARLIRGVPGREHSTDSDLTNAPCEGTLITGQENL